MPSGIYIHKSPSEETREKLRQAQLGIPKNGLQEKNHQWKGEQAGLRAIHIWVAKWKGRPETCEGCGKSGLTGCQINWANIDHKYRRVLEDYIRLCSKCHGEYDSKNGFRKRKGTYLDFKEYFEFQEFKKQRLSN